jgi:hypothetical protein
MEHLSGFLCCVRLLGVYSQNVVKYVVTKILKIRDKFCKNFFSRSFLKKYFIKESFVEINFFKKNVETSFFRSFVYA